MPAPNDLTPEEEAQFVEHGVQPSGPGGEPIAEGQEEQQGAEPQGQEQGGEPPAQTQEPAPGELGSNRRADGQFKSKAELDADAATLASQGQGGQQAQPRMVPHEALHETRQQLAESRRQAQMLTTRMNAILMAQQGKPGQQEQMPDLATNPAEYIQALADRLERFEQGRAEEQQIRQVEMSLGQDEEIFSQSVPDYDQASDYYVQSRARELLQFYPPQEAQRILTNEAHNIAQQAWARGQSAAAMVYGLAQARGYAPANTAADPVRNPIPPRNGPTPQAQVEAIGQGRAASRSLSGGGAGAGTTQLNAEALLNMSDEEFEAYLQLDKKGANERFAAVG